MHFTNLCICLPDIALRFDSLTLKTGGNTQITFTKQVQVKEEEEDETQQQQKKEKERYNKINHNLFASSHNKKL